MLKKLSSYIVLFLLPLTSFFSPFSFANDPIVKPFTAHYSIIHKSKTVGTGIRQLKYLADGTARYSYQTDIEWLIFSDQRKETSIVKLLDGHVIPFQYSYDREGTGRDKHYEWQFDIKKNLATNLVNQKQLNIEFPDNIQDKLSYHLQHRIHLIQNFRNKSPQQEHYVYPIIGTSGTIKNHVYQYDGEEELMLPYGLVKTIRLKREVEEKKRITYVWFAPELDFLLVKLHQIKGEIEQFEAQLNSVTIAE